MFANRKQSQIHVPTNIANPDIIRRPNRVEGHITSFDVKKPFTGVCYSFAFGLPDSCEVSRLAVLDESVDGQGRNTFFSATFLVPITQESQKVSPRPQPSEEGEKNSRANKNLDLL